MINNLLHFLFKIVIIKILHDFFIVNQNKLLISPTSLLMTYAPASSQKHSERGSAQRSNAKTLATPTASCYFHQFHSSAEEHPLKQGVILLLRNKDQS